MGHWSMHVEGAGIHDNGVENDAEAMLKRFVEDLAKHHRVDSATFTVGGIRELVHPSALNEADPARKDDAEHHERAYRHRS